MACQQQTFRVLHHPDHHRQLRGHVHGHPPAQWRQDCAGTATGNNQTHILLLDILDFTKLTNQIKHLRHIYCQLTAVVTTETRCPLVGPGTWSQLASYINYNKAVLFGVN